MQPSGICPALAPVPPLRGPPFPFLSPPRRRPPGQAPPPRRFPLPDQSKPRRRPLVPPFDRAALGKPRPGRPPRLASPGNPFAAGHCRPAAAPEGRQPPPAVRRRSNRRRAAGDLIPTHAPPTPHF